MAGLYKQDGLYYGQFYSQHRNPQRKRVPLKTKKADEARKRLASLEIRYREGDFDPWQDDPWRREEGHEDQTTVEATAIPPVLLGQAIEDYLASCSHLRPVTIKTYKEILDPFCKHVGSGKAVTELEPRHISMWLDSTSAGAVTRRKYLNHLGYLFRHLVREGRLAVDLSKMVKLPKLPEQTPKAMTPEMIEAFLSKANNWHGYDYSWLGDIVEANVEMGLRRGEIIALKSENVDLERRILRVVNGDGFSTKSGKERAIPLSSTAVRVLQRRLDSGHAHVFSPPQGPIADNGLSHAFRRVREKAGLPGWVNLHSTRHTALTRLAEAGVPVEAIRQFAGHSSITVTERYTRFRPDIVMGHVLRALG